MATLKGKSCWSYLNTPDTKFEPCWRIDLVVDAEEARKAKELGLKIHRTDELKDPVSAALGQYRIKFVRYVNGRGKRKGTQNQPPIAMDVDNNELTDIIGNGSDVIVGFRLFEWNNKFGKGISADLEKVKVLNLVEYVPKDKVDEDDTEVKEIKTDDDDF